LENLNIDIAFSQSQVVLKTLSATIGGGTITGQGTMSVRNLQPDTLDLGLTATKLTVTLPGLYSGGIDGSLTLTGPAHSPTLGGTVTLSHGTVALAESAGGSGLGAASAPSIPLALDASLVIGDDVTYVLGPARARLAGSVHASGTIQKPALSGQIEAVSGSVRLLGTPFTLTQAVATFSEDHGIYPQIAVTAQGLYGPTRVVFSVTGFLPNPTINVSSDPPMSQDQILGLIAGTNGGQGSATGLLSQALFGSVTSSVQQAFGVDMTLSYESQAPLNLQIGRYLLSNLYLSVGAVVGRTSGYNRQVFGTLQPTNPNGEPYTVLGLQYTLSPSLSLSYYADSFGDNAFFVLNRIQF
jgi:translocation and assembly module TamB